MSAQEARLKGRLNRSALIEIGLFLGLALLLDHFFFGGTRYWQVSPHPFWLVVLLMSVHYGTAEGLAATVFSTVALLVGNLPSPGLTQDTYDYLFQVTRTPLLWLAAALIFGELRVRQLRQEQELKEDLAASERREETIAGAYKKMGLVKEKLEARVASQMRTGIGLLQAAKSLETLEPEEVLFGVVDIVRALMDPEKFSLYLMREGVLELTIQEGWSSADSYKRGFPPGSLMFQEIIGRQKVLCCANGEDEKILEGQGILAGPLVGPESGEVLGMLKVEKMGFLEFNFSSVQTFKVLCEWVATAYDHARRYQLARSESVLSADTRLLSYGFLGRQTSFLSELAKRVGFDLCMIVLRVENAEVLSPEESSFIPKALAEAVKKVLRKSDLAFDYQRTGWEFAIVLPGTPIENAQIAANKLLNSLKANLNGRAPQARFSLTTQSIHKERKFPLERHALLSHDHFPRQTEALANLARRMDFDLSMIVIRLVKADQLSEEQRRLVPGVVNNAIRRLLPRDTPAFAYQRSGLEFALVLPDVPIPDSQRIADELLSELGLWVEDKSREACFSLTVQAIHAGQRREALNALEV